MTHFSTPIPVEHYQQLIEISLDLASTLDLKTLLHRINALALDLTDAEASAIYFFDERHQNLSLAVTDSPQTQTALENNHAEMETALRQVAQCPQALMLAAGNNPPIENCPVEIPANLPAHSLMAAPMSARGKVIGVLLVINKRSDIFTQADLGKLQVLSAQGAVAIENSRLFQQADLISDFVHELRTPLSSINTLNELLQREDITLEQRMQLRKLMTNEIQRLKDLTNNFLDLTRLESGRLNFHLTSFHLTDLIQECCNFLKPRMLENDLTCSLELATGQPELSADLNKIKQVLLNLIGNAIRYNRRGGRVLIKAWAEADGLCVSVTDTGIGIPADELPRISERFFRASNAEKHIPGTGLGMCITRQIIEGHQGWLKIESELNVGSTFTFMLPLRSRL